MASLLLQMAVYFNIYFSPFWFIIQLCCLVQKFHLLTQLYKILLITALIIKLPVEAIRLYLGCAGNLMNKVPELAGFWLLTLFIRCPLHIWLMASHSAALHYPVEHVVNVIMMLFISLEVISGYVTLKDVSQKQANKFKMKAQECLAEFQEEGARIQEQESTQPS